MTKQGIFLIFGVIVAVIFIMLMVLLSRGGKELDTLAREQAKIENNLRAAKTKRDKEKAKLANMVDGLKSSFSGSWAVQEQMLKAAGAVSQTDFMFAEASGESPETLFRNPFRDILLDEERREISLILFRWQKLQEISGLDDIDLEEAKKIKEEIETIKAFIDNLSKVVESLTPENSGVSQFQIDIFSTGIPVPEVLTEVLVSMQSIIENSSVSGSGGEVASSFNSPAPIVTPSEVIVQNQTVEDEEENVANLEEQLAQIQQEIQAQSSPPPAPLPPTYVPVPPTQSNGTNTNNNSNYDPYPEYNYDRTVDTNQGIIIQEGEPRLIQGTDPY